LAAEETLRPLGGSVSEDEQHEPFVHRIMVKLFAVLFATFRMNVLEGVGNQHRERGGLA
jgi:hypothetical protein